MITTEAILLRRREMRETSLLVVAYTPDCGKVHGLVKGVRGARAAVPWYLEPMTRQAIVLYERRRSNLGLISSFDLIDPFDGIRRDFVRLSYGTFCLELVDQMTEIGDPHPEIYRLLLSVLRSLAEGADPAAVARFLEVHLLQIQGVLPDPGALRLSPGGRLSLERMLTMRWEELRRLALSPPVAAELRLKLQGLLDGVLERELRSRRFLLQTGCERGIDRPALPARSAA
ncbi:MAG: DNA repair protein RecO [Candidatus Omnitrophica bacterium CG11_big_fil_rev_8_21_14_0_20_64_10]|nr:MAG: DNA repair protein RecO [Candidatus Omnitrophica bacterium CG11_big_fil_rev_8_21_14_0_20_64_10]